MDGWLIDRGLRWVRYVPALVGSVIVLVLFLGVVVPNDLILKDGVTYLAAAERLNLGHRLYELVPGDLVPFGFGQPCCPYALMSPPPIAVLWRPIALLDPPVALVAWALLNGVAMLVTLAVLLRRDPLRTGIVMVVLSLPIALEIWLGNVNGLLLAGLVAVWLLAERRHDLAAGALLALLVAIKVWPLLLIVWFLAQGRIRTVAATAIAGIALLGISVLGAGLDQNLRYLSLGSGFQPSEASLAGMIEAISGRSLPWIQWIALAFGLVEVVLLRHRPGLAWAVAIVTMVVANPIIHVGSLVLTIAAVAPYRSARGLGTPDLPALVGRPPNVSRAPVG
jgi:hypothetical protein